MCESSITGEMNQPLLHVMIPAYGEGLHLEETLSSACRNLSNSVLISVVEDPSEQNTIRETVKKFEPRVSYIKNEKRLGIANNFNKCIEISQGVYTQICGHDDLLIKDPSKFLLNFINESSETHSLIFSAKVMHDSDNRKLKLADLAKFILKPSKKTFKIISNKKFLERLMLGYWIYFPAILWRTEVARKYKFDDQFKSAMDLEFLIDMNIANEKFQFKDEELIFYRRHEQSASSTNSIGGDRFFEEMKCHSKVIRYAKNKSYRKLEFLAKVALSVRANAIITTLTSQLRLTKKISNLMKIIST